MKRYDWRKVNKELDAKRNFEKNCYIAAYVFLITVMICFFN